jgi:hypothetical protein
MNGLQHAGAFVLQFREETDFAAGRVTGRVEHVASGQTARFESVDELLATLARLLAEAQAGERQAER